MDAVGTFRRAVLENPGEDTHRLALADWLVEHGEPAGRERGEFIAYQLDAAWHRERGEADSSRVSAAAEYPYRADVWPYEEWPDSAWTLFEMSVAAMRPIFVRWRRGFIDRVSLAMHEFFRFAGRLFRTHPVEEIVLSDRVPHRAGPRTFEWLAHVRIAEAWREAVTPAALPYNFADHLRGYRKVQTGNRGRRGPRTARDVTRYAYPSEAAAHAALSAACVRYGRWLAGLPKLPEPAGAET